MVTKHDWTMTIVLKDAFPCSNHCGIQAIPGAKYHFLWASASTQGVHEACNKNSFLAVLFWFQNFHFA